MTVWTDAVRSDYYKEHPANFAGPGDRYPIKDASDVSDAAQLYGHSSDPDVTKKNIIVIAKRMGFKSALPQEWQEDDIDGDTVDGGSDDDDDYIPDNYGVNLFDAMQQQAPGQGVFQTSQVQNAEIIRLDGSRIVEELEGDRAGHAVRVTVIRGGKSKNGYSYDASALQSIAKMLEGSHAYADHARSPADLSNRSVRDVVGFYHDATFVPPGALSPGGQVDATLHIFEAADWLWSVIHEAIMLGKPELVGYHGPVPFQRVYEKQGRYECCWTQ
jgi:hypothetical protein